MSLPNKIFADVNDKQIRYDNVYSTCYEDNPVSELAERNIKLLKDQGANVFLGVDATTLHLMKEKCKNFGNFDKIVFMFPHIGGKMKIQKNRELIRNFAESAVPFFNKENSHSQVIITLCGGQGGTPSDTVNRAEADTWQIVKMLSYAGLQLVSVNKFEPNKYFDKDSYKSYGYRGWNQWFHTDKGVVHAFEIGKIQLELNPRMLSLESLKDHYIKSKVKLLLNNKTLIGKMVQIVIKFMQTLSKTIIGKPTEDVIIVVDNIEEHVNSRCSNVDNSELDDMKLDLILEQKFTLNFCVCPVQPYILVVNCTQPLKEAFLEKFPSGIVESSSYGSNLLLDLTKLAAEFYKEKNTSETHDVCQWQKMWTVNDSLYPPRYSHCLSFWLPSAAADVSLCKDGQINEDYLAVVLWTCGYDTVTSCEIMDVYERDGKIANTLRLNYQSHFFAMSPQLVFHIQSELIAKTLVCMKMVDVK